MKNNQLLNSTLIFFAIIILGLIMSYVINKNKAYKHSNAFVHNFAYDENTTLKFIDFYNNLDDFFIVDIRTEVEFINGNINNSINIDYKDLYTKSSLKKLRKTNKTIVLYSESQTKSALAVLMLKSLGIDKIKVLAGNYYIYSNYIEKEFNPAFLNYNEDKIKWNYPNFIKTKNEETQQDILPVMIRAKGGC